MDGDIKRAEKFSTLLFIYSHFVAIYHLQGFRPISSAAILQPLSLCIIDYAIAYDVQLTIDKHFTNALLACTLIGDSISVVVCWIGEISRYNRLWHAPLLSEMV